MAAYWPWIYYQAPTGALARVRNQVLSDFRAGSVWDANQVEPRTVMASGSRLAVVPLTANFSSMAVRGGHGVFYQDANERLAVIVPERDADDAPPASLPAFMRFPDIKMAKGGPIAAFSVARAEDHGEGRADVYVLYRDASAKAGDISVLYTDSTTEPEWVVWKTAQPETLRGVADADSELACTTLSMTNSGPEGEAVPLEGLGADTVRCYFQKDGGVVEVKFDGEWSVVGNVPLS